MSTFSRICQLVPENLAFEETFRACIGETMWQQRVPKQLLSNQNLCETRNCILIYTQWGAIEPLKKKEKKWCAYQHTQWHNRQGGWGQGAPETSDREISADLSGKRGKEKIEKGEMEKKRRKMVKRKVENLKWKEGKLQNEARTFFFFSLFKTTKIGFGCTKMEIFYREKKHFTLGKKIRKNDFAPSEKCSCYAPEIPIEIQQLSYRIWCGLLKVLHLLTLSLLPVIVALWWAMPHFLL